MFDIVNFCNDYQIDYSLNNSNNSEGWVGLQDIYSGVDTGYHMGFNTYGNYLYSWKSGAHNLKQYIQDILSISYPEALKILDTYDVYSPTEVIKSKRKFDIIDTPTNPPIRNFLRHRRYNAKQLVAKYDLRGDKHKLVIPIYYKGTIVSYQTRDVRKKEYIACAKDKALMNYKDILYPLDYATQDWCVVVEGIFDAYRLGDNAVCTFGTSWKKTQASLLAERYKRVILLFDNEPEAQRKAKALGVELAMMGVDVEIEGDFLRLMGANDPDELTSKQAKIFMELCN